jgi:hypothetical protein
LTRGRLYRPGRPGRVIPPAAAEALESRTRVRGNPQEAADAKAAAKEAGAAGAGWMPLGAAVGVGCHFSLT